MKKPSPRRANLRKASLRSQSLRKASLRRASPRKASPKRKRIASYGDEDEEGKDTIKNIQTKLYELGYLGNDATGYFGADTVDAIMLFQDKNKLEVTGIADEDTVAKLGSDKAVTNFIDLELNSYDDGENLQVTYLQTR